MRRRLMCFCASVACSEDRCASRAREHNEIKIRLFSRRGNVGLLYVYTVIYAHRYVHGRAHVCVYVGIYTYVPVEQMKCERARETVIIIFVRTVGRNGGEGFALDISLIPGHGSLFVSRGE